MFSPLLSSLSKIQGRLRRVVATPQRRQAFWPDATALEPRIVLSQTAYEIAYLGDLGHDFTGPILVYLSGGSNPIDGEQWESYDPPPGYIKNTPRNLQFNSSTFFSSPDSTANTYITTSDGYTWEYIARTVSSVWPFDPDRSPYSSGYQAAALDTTPPPGAIKWTANTKNQEITWYARNSDGQPIQRYFITDPWGDRFIMQASGVIDESDVRNNFLSAVLPPEWKKSIGYLKRNLTTLPAYSADGTANYNLFRDSADDSFQQISWSERGWGTAQMIAGMPIWGGTNNNTIRAHPTHDNVVYAAGGTDTIYVAGLINTIYGDGGTDTAVFPGRRSQYTVSSFTSDGTDVAVAPKGPARTTHVTTLFSVERMQFSGPSPFVLHTLALRRLASGRKGRVLDWVR